MGKTWRMPVGRSTGFRQRLQSGQAGEIAAQNFFRANKWIMYRSQPPVTILSIVSAPMVATLKRFIPRLAAFGHMVIARLGKGGIPDFTGYVTQEMRPVAPVLVPIYRACEVKECHEGDTMPCSRLDKEQRKFMNELPEGCAWVGVLWRCGTFEMFGYKERGSYAKGSGRR